MLKKGTTSVVLALILAPAASAATFGAWTQGIAEYDLDRSQQACVATTEVRNNASLTLIFPRNKKSLPIIRVTEKFSNFLNGKKYLGVRFLDQASGLKIHGFPVKSGRSQYYYMVPKSAANFNSMINYIRAKGALDMIKIFDDRGSLKANPVKFSLSGSTNATNAIKSCLGSSTFLSSSQSRLIDVLDKYKNDAVSANPGTSLDNINRRGSNMLGSLRDIMRDGDRLEPLERELSALENNERYIEIKKSYETNNAIFNTQKRIVRSLSDNQDFFNNADQIISDLEQEITGLKSSLSSLENERAQIASRLSVIEREIRDQEIGVSRDRQARDFSAQNLAQARSALAQVNRDISESSRELGSKEEMLRNLQLDVRPLRQNLRVAEGRYNDRERLKREARRRLTDSYGQPDELARRIQTSKRELDAAKLAKRVSSDIKKQVNTIKAKISDVEGVDAKVKSNQTRIDCLEKLISEGGNQSPKRACGVRIRENLTKTLGSIKSRKNQLISERSSEVTKLKINLRDLSSPRGGRDLVQAITALKSCDDSKMRDCKSKAGEVETLINRRLRESDGVIAQKEKAFKESTAKLAALEKALEENVRGLDQRLRDEVNAARRVLGKNEQDINDAINRVSFLERELDSLLRSQDRLGRQVRSEESMLATAQRVYEDTLGRLEDYKRSVGYQQILDRQSVVVRAISSNEGKLAHSERTLISSRTRKEQIALEIDTYPARISDAQDKRDAAEVIVNDLGPEYNELTEDVSRVRSAYNRLVSDLKPDLIRFQAEFKTVIKNLF